HALAGTGVERRLTGELTHLLRQRGAVVTRRQTEHHATTPPVRDASGTLTRTTSALLLPRLLVAARDFLAALGLGRALALVAQVRRDGLVQHRLVHGPVEQVGGKRERLGVLLAGRGVVRGLNHGGSSRPASPR